MMKDLQEAKFVSADLPDADPIEPVTREYTGRPGHPRVIINPEVLETSYAMRGPTALGRVFNVSSQLVRRCALELGIVESGDPVYVKFIDQDGSTMRYYLSSTTSQSTLPDEDLTVLVSKGLLTPNFFLKP